MLERTSPGRRHQGGVLCISLDLELMWGAKEKWRADGYGRNVLGERQAIPAMLDLFERHGLHATWAAVGFMMCRGKDELLGRRPSELPAYADNGASAYAYLDGVGETELDDPLHFGASLVERIADTPHQEIATHTFSHFYTLEPGATLESFRADLQAARTLAEDRKLPFESIVFPRNQYGPDHLRVAAEAGLKCYRGNERSWVYAPSSSSRARSTGRRLGRVLDTYLDLTGPNTSRAAALDHGLWNVPASRFLRPQSGSSSAALRRLKLARITRAMEMAAARDEIFHLWWHPHNFGADVEANIAFLSDALSAFGRLRDGYGMRSLTMSETAKALAEQARTDTPPVAARG